MFGKPERGILFPLGPARVADCIECRA
jgi:hypothetical protein